MTDLRGAIEALADAGVRFIVVGGIAGIAHGSARVTFDIDLVYGRDPQNLERLAATLAPHRPTLRGAPAGPHRPLDSLSGSIGPGGEVAMGGASRRSLPHTMGSQASGRTTGT